MSVVNKEVIDRLTPWLLTNLHSEDLDAKDMADYVVSLISAPGSEEQLYTRCKSELEEFLGAQTETFVNALFQQIKQLMNNDSNGNNTSSTSTADQQQQQQQQQSTEQALSGGQEEFRRNFRGDFSPMPQQTHQQQPPSQGFPPQGFPPQGFPPQGFPPQGFPPQGFPPNFPANFPPNGIPTNGMPPQFGFQGFGRPGKFNNGQQRGPPHHQQHGSQQKPNQRRLHSALSSVHNEHSVANRWLVIEQIPAEHLNRESVETHFSRFGKLTNIRINEQQSLIEIEFEGHDQAVEAHKCPDPIFGNRFVKVFWRKHAPEETPELDIEAVRRMQAIKQQQFDEKEAKRKHLTSSLRAIMAEQASILQQRQQMLQSGQVDPNVQAEMQSKSELLSSQLLQMKQELKLLQGSGTGPTPSHRGGSYRGRGSSSSSSSPYGRGGGRVPRGGYRGGGVGAYIGGANNRFQGASLDRRPKGVLVEGITPEKDENLRGELASRNYTDFQRKSNDAVLIEFADRRSAEEFFHHEIPEIGEVKKSWAQTGSQPVSENQVSENRMES